MDTKKSVATVPPAELPATAGFMDDLGNSGFENVRPEDIAIPFIRVLQSNSPQCHGPEKIPGAMAGQFYNTVTHAVYKDHIDIIPCAFQKVFIEWTPREQGGGFIKEYLDSSILSGTKKNDKNVDVLPNGNVLIPTAKHWCLLLKEDGGFERAVLSLTSTQLKKSRNWLSQMLSLQISFKGKKFTPPMYSHSYTVTATEESNDLGSWYGYKIGNPVLYAQDPKNADLYQDAKKFYSDVTSGSVKSAVPVDAEAEAKVDTSKASEHF
jgi:hypothetical protein